MLIYTEPDFRNLPAPMARLFDAAHETSFFAQAGWYDLMARHARRLGAEFRLYLDSAAPTVGLLFHTSGPRRLRGVSNAYTMEYGPIGIADTQFAPGVARLASAIAAEDTRREMITMDALDPSEPSYTALVDGLRAARWVVKPFFDCGVWYEDTSGLDFQHYFEMRPSVLRNMFHRKDKAARSAGARFLFADPGSDIEQLVADYEMVYRQSWKEEELFPDFMPNLVRHAFRTNALRMGVVRIGGVPAAAQFWIVWRGRAVIYKLAHDERFANLSPGTLLTMRMMERVLEMDRPSEVNFGRGDDPYKKMWLPRRRERWGLYAGNPRTARGAVTALRWLAGRARDRARGKI